MTRRRRGCWRWPGECPCPGGGVLFVTIGSTFGSKNIGCRRASMASSDSPVRRVGERGAVLLRDLRRVGKGLRRALQHELASGEVVVGPVVDPEQLRVALDLRQRRRHRHPAGGRRSARERRASRARWRASGRRRCHGRRSRPGTDARSASSLSAAATRSRPRRVAPPRPRRRVRGGTRARRPAERPARQHLAILPGCRRRLARARGEQAGGDDQSGSSADSHWQPRDSG